MIRAWKDWDNPEYDDAYLTNRACQWARAFAEDKGRGHKRPTGHLGISKEGVTTASGDRNREKIFAYQAEFYQIHGRQPNSVETSNATGIKASNVRELLAKAQYHHAPKGRLSEIIPLPMSLDWVIEGSADTDLKVQSWLAQADDTQEVVSNDHIRDLLSHTTPLRAEWIFLHRVCGWTGREIADKYGWTGAYQYIDKEIRLGLKDIREALT